ncbi:protein of unknown function [Pseudomonas sp. JV241A]|nr:protein of unknown function [Pseudomonas sp. JV241A]
MIPAPSFHPEAAGLIGIGVPYVDVRFHGVVSTGLQSRDEIGFVVVTETLEDEVEADVTFLFARFRSMAVSDIETWIRLLMPGQESPKRVYSGAFAHVVGTDENIQSRLKFQLDVTQLAEIFYGEFSQVHEGLHP